MATLYMNGVTLKWPDNRYTGVTTVGIVGQEIPLSYSQLAALENLLRVRKMMEKLDAQQDVDD